MVFANCQGVCSVPLFRSLMEMLDGIDHSINPSTTDGLLGDLCVNDHLPKPLGQAA